MILMDDIVKGKNNEILRKVSTKVELPVSDEILEKLKEMVEYLENSQDDEIAEKYGLRAGVGLAAPQIGLNKRMFAIFIDDEDKPIKYGVINPEIIGESIQKIYLPGGEGCLSLPEDAGTVPRFKKIKVRGLFYYPLNNTIEEKTMTISGYHSIVFQHEFDHLNGILFTDKVTDDLGNVRELDD